MNTDQKIEKVKEIFKNYEKVALAFSGGADSTLLAYLAKEAGADVLAITYNNQIFPTGFLEFAKRRTSELGIRHEIIENNFIDVDIVTNTPQRCLVCRRLMYGAIKQRAFDEGYEIIIDGNNITDLTHDRPGILMKYEYEIESPFIEAELETYEIHQFLDENDIEYSNSTTCLATRVKTNEIVTIDKVNRIDHCEAYVKEITGSDVVKLREEKNVATIELSDLDTILDKEKIDSIVEELKLSQYDKILLNLKAIESDDELILDDELEKGANNLRLRKRLPFGIDISETGKILKNKENDHISNIETIEDIGYIKLQIDEKESKIFRDGKISIENNKNKEDAKESLVKILPFIRRTV
ncbi:MAG: ATP-dependent sacrificial sulfur transferase LarE [Methanobrevibacter olleyae]|uniref:ATP-dependent sacrificial sulfur transferase LarE n=1 Tax=Methanobrevibacter olleyae TaxID=294671 RepID=A0A8T3VSD3_METOL|nr:ATP-dependent sacrificial sulfur transferase LarE [Methanobrevibacter olleyae]